MSSPLHKHKETNLSEENVTDPVVPTLLPNDVKSKSFHIYLKYISLIMFTLQNIIRTTLMSYIKKQSGPRFINSTFIFVCEIQKTIFTIFLIFGEERNILIGLKRIYRTIRTEPYATIKICIVALVYTVQNNASLFAIERLDIATYTIATQFKILTTSIFTRFLLKRHLHAIQWFSLILLAVGISIVEIAKITSNKATNNVESVQGFLAVMIACVCSGFAGVYLEKIVKNTNTSLWIYNIQLAIFSIVLSALVMCVMDGKNVKNHGIFYGYTELVWITTIINSIGGLIVALVMKYSDNILKGFASSTSVVLACIIAMILFDFQLTTRYSIGSLIVIFSILIYSKPELILSIPIFKCCIKDKPVFV